LDATRSVTYSPRKPKPQNPNKLTFELLGY